MAPNTAPVTPRFFKTEKGQILPGSQQITTAHHSLQHPSHQRHICSLVLGCQVTFKVLGRRGTAGWRRLRPPGGATHHSHTQHSPQPQSPHQKHACPMATQHHALPAPNIISTPHTIIRHHHESCITAFSSHHTPSTHITNDHCVAMEPVTHHKDVQ